MSVLSRLRALLRPAPASAPAPSAPAPLSPGIPTMRASAPTIPSPDVRRALVLYKYDSCPFCYRVARAIRELGLDVPTRDTLMDRGAREELLAATGRTQVPCLFIDGVPLLESADIVDWLRDYADQGARS